jgi:hypothetical protein
MNFLKPLLTATIFMLAYTTSAQLISGAMIFENPLQAKDSNTLSLAYANAFYCKDYEYFNDIQTGYTYLGTWQRAELQYQPGKGLRLHAGLLAQRDFGDKRFSNVKPVFSLQLQHNNSRFIFGAIEGNQSHGLIEPLMSYDKIIERPVEEGVQYKLKTKKIALDFWLDWEILQKENDNHPEEFAGGTSLVYTLTQPGRPWQLKVPIQFILPHKGGQLDTNNSIVSTVINHAQGLWAEWNNPVKTAFLQQFRADAYHAGFFHSNEENPYPYNSGNGFLCNAYFKSKYNVALLATYWSGNSFVAPRGGKIFQSISSISGEESYAEKQRQLLFINLVYEKQIMPGLYIDARFTPYVDLKNKLKEYSFLLLFTYRDVFRLVNFKK